MSARALRLSRSLILPFLLALPLPAVVGCGSSSKQKRTVIIVDSDGPSTAVYVRQGPPSPPRDVKPARPHKRAVWIPGHWGWSGGQYVWAPGHWDKKPKGKAWKSGHWDKHARGWVWVQGHWR